MLKKHKKRKQKEEEEKRKKKRKEEQMSKIVTKEKTDKAKKSAVAPTANNKKQGKKAGVTGYFGVTISKRTSHISKPYRAQICIHGKQTFLGYYSTAEEAAKKYDEKCIEINRLARLNFPMDDEPSLSTNHHNQEEDNEQETKE
mmetsp:Transcript_45843/g.69151  ORF Transcript_45843/g.69151 Transcript_45843/m.69151 type:complete len:144 (-) Transcript_45843:191-622(-)